MQLMRALIRPWEPGTTYQYSDIVQLNGMTYQAEASDVRLIARTLPQLMVQFSGGAGTHRTGQDVARPRRASSGDAFADMPIDGTSTDAGVDAAGFSVGEEGRPRRARNADGTYRGDDPSTPDVNEAWED